MAKRHPVRTTLAIIFLFGSAEVVYLQAKSAEYAKLLTSFTSVDKRLEQLQKDLGQVPLQPDRRDTEQEPFLTETKLISIYMNEYIEGDLGPQNKRFKKLWEVIPTEPVQILVTEKQGIWVRDFPDGELGRKIPTGGPGSGPTYKALSPDLQKPLAGVFQSFVVTKDLLTPQEVTIWAVRWSSEGGWEQDKQPHPEFFAVYSNGEWLTRFITEYSALWGTTTSGKEFFKGNLPRNLFPVPENGRISVSL